MCFKCDTIGNVDGDVQIVQVIPPKMLDAVVLLREALLSEELGLIARQNQNGSDWFECPCCGAERKEQGYLSGKANIDTVEHDPDCKLFKAHKLLEELDNENPVLFAE